MDEYKQWIYIYLYEDPRIKTKRLATQIGCSPELVLEVRKEWKKLDPETKSRRYNEASRLLAGPDPEPAPDPVTFHTPYNFIKRPRSRMWISHY